ncbi:hypothetical protein F5B19DRAFT_456350 [Rostrohypoxylon terebratum]|nr:hypothetical protein F5B19DRAFT_456350 [Rostrohypoxylon terebratum]
MTNVFLCRPQGLLRFTPHLLTLRRCATNGNPFSYPYPYGDIGTEGIESGALGSGHHVRSVSEQYQIALPTSHVFRHLPLNQLRMGDNSCKLNIMYAQCHVFDDQSGKYLDKYEHPFAKSVLNMYIKKKEEPLWYRVFSHPVARAFPCRVAAKRVRHAFLDALAYHGYDRYGKKIVEDDSSHIASLCGTVKLGCGDPKAACNIKFADLLEQFKLIVAGLETFLAKDKNGHYITISQPKNNTFSYNKKNKANNKLKKTDKPDGGNLKKGTRPGPRPAQHSPNAR